MGNPNNFYVMALQEMAYQLTWEENIKKAKELRERTEIEWLENYINEKKRTLSTEKFFYCAGLSSMAMAWEVDEHYGCDGMNASIGGLISFEHFIGLRNDDE